MRFTPADFSTAFNAGAVARGKQYWQQHRVQHFALREDADAVRIEATVEGAEAAPYALIATVAPHPHGLRFESHCSCPLGGDCKHVVAALLEACNRWQRSQGRSSRAEPAAETLSHEVRDWLARLTESPPASAPAAGGEQRTLLYIMKQARERPQSILVQLCSARLLKGGGIGAQSLEPYHNVDGALRQPPKFITEDDRELLRALHPYRGSGGEYRLRGRSGVHVLEMLLASERCYWHTPGRGPLRTGAPRSAEPQWQAAEDGSQRLGLCATPAASGFLSLNPPWYVDAGSGECGPVQTELPAGTAAALVDAPLLPAQVLPQVAQRLAQTPASRPLPAPPLLPLRKLSDTTPQPLLQFYGREGPASLRYGPRAHLGMARLFFIYHDRRVAAADSLSLIAVGAGREILQIERNRKAELDSLSQLAACGLVPAARVLQSWEMHGVGRDDYTLQAPEDDTAWAAFMIERLPGLVEQGWKIEYEPGFPHRYAEVEEWFGEVSEGAGNDWFGLELGIQVGGERINLLPLLIDALRSQPQMFSLKQLADISPGQQFVAELPDGRRVALPLTRVQPILQILIELYDGQPLDADGRLRMSRVDALRLAELDAANAAARTRWLGAETLLELGRRLGDFRGIAAVAPPAGLHATLRPYQLDGLGWLQFLREYGFGGILADDMGLGKTVQTLAHLLIEQEAGRLDCPALVIAPTSLVGNWQREARQFAPGLRVLALHGAQRHQHFARLAQYDLVVTTYPLLAHDIQVLRKQEFHLLVLDEAQNIKNARTQAARMVQQIKTRHRLCLTGTPMENHLGELWSQFHFLQPGLLGDERQFRRLYRTPIEKQGDDERRVHLLRRVAPFILRRTKQQVLKDLPPKTEIVRSVALTGEQRDLYETLRLAMHEKIRDEIASKGLGRSHIVILDALLKLRQTCCDPRLLSLASAQRAAGVSAKLELLMELLPEMLEEGRRVLLFSQFTSMLALIEAELIRRGIRYLKLTGETRNRTELVDRFQNGETPLFLISLKAGGTGLNLTAADAVIHYDPWWNPAVENQATDRAHRIGQDKPVFVYKLIVEGSVEEKIMAMQQRKAELAAGILDDGAGRSGTALDAQDLQALFEPLA
ncbi:MAG TPA: DEAD/DEAH box helicase [Stenotrophobium sp.]|nr:DEAD/DEAH box helicase [Stenotrophobium sp.]